VRRRTLLATPVVGLLAACDGEEGADPAVVTVDPAAVQREEPLEQIDPSSVNLPLDMAVMAVVATDWTAAPMHLDGVLLGYGDEGERLRYTAVDQQGTLLWEALRPLACTGAALSRDRDGRAIAVLPDVSVEDGQIAAMSLTGYDLSTAEVLWGPTPVPGPQAAPGMVFAGSGDQPMGEGGPRVAIDAGTGEVAVSEEALDGGRILAEHLGVMLHMDGEELVATGTAEGTESWRVATPGPGPAGDPDPWRHRPRQRPGRGRGDEQDRCGGGRPRRARSRRHRTACGLRPRHGDDRAGDGSHGAGRQRLRGRAMAP